MLSLKLIACLGLSLFLIPNALVAQIEPLAIDLNDPDIERAWENFSKAQEQSLALVKAQEQFADNPASMAEGYQMVLRNVIDAITISALQNPYFPRFVPMADLNSKSGMDNPDNEYRAAIIDGTQKYRITGRLNSGRALYLQSIGGQPGVGTAGPGDIIDTVAFNDLVVDDEGRFEIIASAERPLDAENWLKLEPRAETALARFTDSAWRTNPKPDWLLIERMCSDCPSSPPVLNAKRAAFQINRAAQSLHDRTASWLAISKRIWAAVPANTIGRFRETRNGLKGQYSAFGTFDLQPDEALIITVRKSDAPYQGIQLASRWFVSMNYRTRITSLTSKQANVGDDGMIRFVIADRDPGVWNWLDTSGHRRGLIMMRWQGLGQIPNEVPVALKVLFDEIGDHLPPETEEISEAERREQIKSRMLAIDRRFQ